MYPMLLLAAGASLWMYLRLTYQLRATRRTDFLALLAAVYLMLNVHVFSVTFLVMLGIHHLLVVPKNRRWWEVSAVIAAAVLLFSPYLTVLLTSGLELTRSHWGEEGVDAWQAIVTWLTVLTNGFPLLLLLISLICLLVGIARKSLVFKPYFLLVLPFIAGLGLAAELTELVTASGMRHQLTGWYVLAIFVVAGLYAAYAIHKWSALLLLLWVASGIGFQQTANWRDFIAGRASHFTVPPWQLISRLALRSDNPPLIAVYSTPYHHLGPKQSVNYSPKEHYFDNRGIDLEIVGDQEALDKLSHFQSIVRPEIWLVYVEWIDQRGFAAEIEEIARRYDYQICESNLVGVDTVIIRTMWRILECEEPDTWSTYKNELIDYGFYKAKLDSEESKIVFVDEWKARDDALLEDYQMSYQLISPDWRNVAQLDLPLVHNDTPRRFSIDVSHVSTGSYRLMAVLYNTETGERVNWKNYSSDQPDMLFLTDIELP